MNADPERDDALLDAMLQDENWQTASAAFKAEALRTFRVRQRIRWLTRWAGSVAVLAAVIAGAAHWFGPRATAPRPIMVAHIEVPKAPDQPRHLTDAELVAAFPRGSCFIAEVDGQKELIFFNPDLKRTYVAGSAARGN
jgi:hypothetical protein